MENLTVIIPVHEFNKTIETLLTKSIKSVTDQGIGLDSILIVGPGKIMPKLDKFGTKTLINNDSTDYCSQINLAVKNCNTKYFSILGFDDTYSKTWFKNVKTYIDNMPEYSIFVPIVKFVDKDENDLGMVNEIIWAMSFSNEIGVIDEEILQTYYDFSVNGAVFRTDDFIEVGMLKPSIKLAFWYEFLMRSTNQNIKIYVIPKKGYNQLVEREGSLSSETNKNMDSEERAWWIKLATKEYYFKQERKKSYTYVPEKKLEEIEGLN